MRNYCKLRTKSLATKVLQLMFRKQLFFSSILFWLDIRSPKWTSFFLEMSTFWGFCLHFSPRSYKTFFPKRMLIPSSNASFGSPSFFRLLSEKSRERAVEMQSSSKVGELKTNFLFWDKEPLHLVEKEKGLVPSTFYFGSSMLGPV